MLDFIVGLAPDLAPLLLFLSVLLVGMARFEFPQMDNESYPSWIADDLDRRTLVQGGIGLDPSQFSENSNGYKYLESGTLLGRTTTEANNGTGFGPAADTDDEYYLAAHDVQYITETPEVAAVRPDTLIRADQLPNWGSLSSALKTVIKDKYEVLPGTG